MRGLVRVIPMKRDIMKIPTLVSKPQVRWTSENAAKSTTTAEFYEKTLTVYKVAAMKKLSFLQLKMLLTDRHKSTHTMFTFIPIF